PGGRRGLRRTSVRRRTRGARLGGVVRKVREVRSPAGRKARPRFTVPCNTGATKPCTPSHGVALENGPDGLKKAVLPCGGVLAFSVGLLRDQLVEEVDVRRAPLDLLDERLHRLDGVPL